MLHLRKVLVNVEPQKSMAYFWFGCLRKEMLLAVDDVNVTAFWYCSGLL